MNQNPTNEQMNHGEFLRNLGMSSAALMAFYCMGTGLTACSKGSNDPAPSTPTSGITGNADASAGTVNFTVDLTNNNFSNLKTVGNFVKVGSVLIANAAGNKYVTIQRLCTHQNQDAVSYAPATTQGTTVIPERFVCSAHGSVFNLDGTVRNGPATTAAKLYTSTISADGNTLTVRA